MKISVLEANLSPSNIELSTLVGDTILNPFFNSTTCKWLLSIIFDTRASLAIMPELLDVVDPPKPLARPMCLGGMASGIENSGIGFLVWTFTARDGTEV
jgi:hypothetical protein